MISLLAASSSATAHAGLMPAALFYLFAAVVGASAIGLVLSANIVRMAMMLLFTLTGVAGLYFLLSAEFLGAVQLVVYVGGTLILIVFGVMLTNKTPLGGMGPKRGEVVVAIALGMVLLAVLVWGIFNTKFAQVAAATSENYPMDKLGQVLLGDFLVPFEVVSVLLLVVMIGAAYLAKARKRDSSR